MGKTGTFLDDDDFYAAHEDSLGAANDHDHAPHYRAPHAARARDGAKRLQAPSARRRLDSRSEELWLRRQLADWDDESFG